MKKIPLVLLILLSLNCFAQFSKTHYIPPISCNTNLAFDHYFYISTPSTTNVSFKIIAIGGTVINGVVNNTTPYVHSIGTGSGTQLMTPKTVIGKIIDKGYIIEADDLVYVSMRINSALNTNTGNFNHAGGLVSKGNSALGTIFRLGAMFNPVYDVSLLNFSSILATENNTTLTISNIPNGTILTDGTIINGPITLNLNKNESYVLALENYNNSNSNSSNMIGALVETDKPVAVNSGSFAGSNSISSGRDIGFDQIVPFEKTGKEYVFVKGLGSDDLERVLIIAQKDQTVIYLNGSTTPFKTLNAGEFADIGGSYFSNGNLYLTSSENVFAYQSIGARGSSAANQNLFFVPPVNCTTPRIVDNIPLIQSIGNTTYTGGLNIVTETGASVTINNSPITTSPVPITGNPGLERYTVDGLSGNISVKSTKQLYVSYYGTNTSATYGGYYSGFDTKPEVISSKISNTASSCIPNIILKTSTISSYDAFQWFFNDVAITGATTPEYTPTAPGYYAVRGTISNCPNTIPLFSDKIPVSECPTDFDGDTINDNIDLDNDNDGITNCTESYGNQNINTANSSTGTIAIGDYSNTFSGQITTSTNSSTTPFTGNANGIIVTETPTGIGNFVKYKMTFNQPISIGLEYAPSANTTDLLNSNAEFIVNSDTNRTITVLNPSNQLLIDTNYDGIYESGVTEYSSFEIRFRLNNVVPLAAGTGDFKFLTSLTKTFSIQHKNLSETNTNKATFKLYAQCIPRDSDGDSIADQFDLDSDNDGILDRIEAQNNNALALANSDTNKDGIDNAFGNGLTPVDTDNDGIPDYIDWDSDNDGINDIDESGTNATNPDVDNDGIKNYRELDSDNDLCNDVIEAGFFDFNNDGILGSSPVTVNTRGQVTSAIGYTTPNNNYIIAAPILITTQPIATPFCELQNSTISIASNGDSYQWQVSTDGLIWNSLTNNTTYSGVTTNILAISNATLSMNGYKYRVFVNKSGNSCGLLSSETTLQLNPAPVVNDITIVQCDDNSDGFTAFNLTVKNKEISANSTSETFSYYSSQTGATTANPAQLITNPQAYTNTVASPVDVWARVTNANGCFRVAKITLKVSTTTIPSSFNKIFEVCDDYIDEINNDKDGIATFDFSSSSSALLAQLPASSSSYSIKYYANGKDALAEINEITNTNNYRNQLSPNQQFIWVRVDSDTDNSCYGIGPYVKLVVNPKPKIDLNSDGSNDVLICSNLPSFVVELNAGILDGSSTSNYTYIWSKDGQNIPGATNPTLNINSLGNYSVEVTSKATGCSQIRNIKATPSNIATITSIEVIDFSENNSITVNTTGPGKYVYNIDDVNAYFQESNVFDNVALGIHVVSVKDLNGCGTVNQTVTVVGAPKFFTPNNDGYNDYWNIKGITNSQTFIYIFDRYGKLLKTISPLEQGWDGLYNGSLLPADDYWYTIKLDDGREAKGHFSLKR
ncbi:T9SS type B sorting domain-containing protein [Flavobacterium sp. NG2]|uniref:T9SS type B sorting domain-containing protein n=1 Tax=Flavobacterium sp. NG2 TaxID=3097547 RepID=UPI002A818463|nr:T9SS type B sorting domain-containing protein [Flavobacterium sp. NG2]WPR70271.1 T9SS type B sorting domain-containing protein [Flavobacterium sp. NG2]